MDLVIADDFSGAAEIAGIAARGGRGVEFCTRVPSSKPDKADVLVIDTDTRLLEPVESARRVQEICHSVRGWSRRVFKKIDSVLRGPVAEEIDAALNGLGLDRAVVCSANPSKDRIVKGGEYFVSGHRLHETAFADDPLHPATTSIVRDCVGNSQRIETPDAASLEDIQRIADGLSDRVLAVGAADLFGAFIGSGELAPPSPLPEGARLWICGSQVGRADRDLRFAATGVPMVLLNPDHCDLEMLVAQILGELKSVGMVAMELDGHIKITPENTDLLLEIVTNVSKQVLERGQPRIVFTEGGATARTVIDAAGWGEFSVHGELSAGVVALEPRSSGWPALVVVKPGSYAWPAAIYPAPAPKEST